MKKTTPEREAIYDFFLDYLNMTSEEIAEVFEISHSSLRRKSSGWLEKCHRITLKLFQIPPETIEENEKID
jgi:phage regulator Rha-like protein